MRIFCRALAFLGLCIVTEMKVSIKMVKGEWSDPLNTSCKRVDILNV